MSHFDLTTLKTAVARYKRVARVVITSFQGSSPRETGTSMLVWDQGQSGTIGGGALEFEASKAARNGFTGVNHVPLGPALGQCCGGNVTLLTESFTTENIPNAAQTYLRQVDGRAPCPLNLRRLEMQANQGHSIQTTSQDGWVIEPICLSNTPLWVYGAGHVGRAIIRVFEDLPFNITLIDDAENRFPETLRPDVTPLLSTNPAQAVRLAPHDAVHIVLTYSHALDLEICHQVLLQPHKHLGLIGSDTKSARFRRRLSALGHSPATISRLNCPIGDRSLGKRPTAIAIGLATELLQLRDANMTELEARA